MGEDRLEFIDEVYKIVHSMGLTSIEKVELDSYQSREVAQVWCTQWKDNRQLSRVP